MKSVKDLEKFKLFLARVGNNIMGYRGGKTVSKVPAQ